MKMKDGFGLYLVMTDPVAGYEACAAAAVKCGVKFVQLRMKNELPENIISTAKKIRQITHGTATRFIVNDDVDIAIAVDADGVHLGQDDMPLDEARRKWNAPEKIFGLSTHSEAQAAAAVALTPDYIGVGPVFPTPTKAIPDPALGVELTGKIICSSPLPCVAIGGLDETNLSAVLRAGAKNFCAVRAIMKSQTPENEIRKFLRLLEQYKS
ncbi:MAG: thiamine phosphate synthase [Kiritimatiellales bacterium]